jgi:carnitine O-acetyltransferase
MGEHSVMDGTPTARMCDDILESLHDPSFDHGAAPNTYSPPPTPSTPIPLDWHVSPATKAAIAEADKAAAALIDSQALGYHLTPYGKNRIKGLGISPDSWAQMVVQLAYARLLRGQGIQRAGGTYEAATTRRFFKGRTEAIRVVSAESDKWVRSMDNPKSKRGEKRNFFRDASTKHLTLARESGNAMGIDRLMLGWFFLDSVVMYN